MNPVMFVLLLIASPALAMVTECVGDSTRPTPPTLQADKASAGQPIVLPLRIEEFLKEAYDSEPQESVCLKKVKCADYSPVDYEELQRDEAVLNASSSTEASANTTSTADSTEPTTPPPLNCSFEVQETVRHHGQCVRMGRRVGGCMTEKYLKLMLPPCHPPPQD